MKKSRLMYSVWLSAVVALHVSVFNMGTWVVLLLSLLLPFYFIVLAALSAKKIMITIDFPKQCYIDEVKELKISIENHSKIQAPVLLLSICKNNLLTGVFGKETIRTSLDSKSTVNLEYEIEMKHCGCVHIDTRQSRVSDYLGLVSFHLKRTTFTECCIMPKLFETEIQIRENAYNMQIMKEHNGYLEKPLREESSETFSIREYVGGDPIRNIHWKLSEKVDKTLVKEAGLPVSENFLIVLDNAFYGVLSNAEREDIIDSVLTTFLSLSNAFLSLNINHMICWKDQKTQSYKYHEIDTKEDLNRVKLVILSNPFVDIRKGNPLYNHLRNCLWIHEIIVSTDFETDVSGSDILSHKTLLFNDWRGKQFLPETKDVTVYPFSSKNYSADLGGMEI